MGKYELKGNSEYAAQVIEVKNVTTFDSLDNLVGITVNGMTALVQKDIAVGDRLLVFPAGSQLAEEFARDHELMRDQGGYLEDKRRVKAIRLRGVPSNMLAIRNPYTDVDTGTLFDTVDEKAICWKYEPPIKQSNQAKAQVKAWKRVDDKMLPEHLDTSNWYRSAGLVPMDSVFTLTQKLHGSSVRIGYTVVKRRPTWLERFLVRFGIAEYV